MMNCGGLSYDIVFRLLFFFASHGWSIITISRVNPHLLEFALSFHFTLLPSQIPSDDSSLWFNYLHFTLRLVNTLEKSINYQPILVREEWEGNTWSLKLCENAITFCVVLINEPFAISLIAFFIVSFLSLLCQGYSLCIKITKSQDNHLRQFLNPHDVPLQFIIASSARKALFSLSIIITQEDENFHHDWRFQARREASQAWFVSTMASNIHFNSFIRR